MDAPSGWPFNDPPTMAVITTRPIMMGEDWFAFVTHDEDDGGWQFHGSTESKVEEAMIVGLGEILNHDPSIAEIADLPLGAKAWRSNLGGIWTRA